MEYPQIKKLAKLQQIYNTRVSKVAAEQPSDSSDELIHIEFSADYRVWQLYIEDEYQDFNEDNQPLCLFLTIRSLEDFSASKDYLDWCNIYGLEASDTLWLHYYRELPTFYAEIEHLLGKVDSCITSLDYQQRSGAFAELLKGRN